MGREVGFNEGHRVRDQEDRNIQRCGAAGKRIPGAASGGPRKSLPKKRSAGIILGQEVSRSHSPGALEAKGH